MRRNSLKELVVKNNGGRPLREILADAVRNHGEITSAAEDIGINAKTFRTWMSEEGITVQRQTTVTA